jgi:hypothetical protein
MAAESRGALQLLDAIDARDGAAPEGCVPLPPGFLEEFSSRNEGEALQGAIAPMGGWRRLHPGAAAPEAAPGAGSQRCWYRLQRPGGPPT